MPSTCSPTTRTFLKQDTDSSATPPIGVNGVRTEASAPKQTETPPDSQVPSIDNANVSFHAQKRKLLSALETLETTVMSFQRGHLESDQSRQTTTSQVVSTNSSASDSTTASHHIVGALSTDSDRPSEPQRLPTTLFGIEVSRAEALKVQESCSAKLAYIQAVRLERRKKRREAQKVADLLDNPVHATQDRIKASDLPKSPIYCPDARRNAILSGLAKDSLRAELDLLYAIGLEKQRLEDEQAQAEEDFHFREFHTNAVNIVRKRLYEEANEDAKSKKKARRGSCDSDSDADDNWLARDIHRGVYTYYGKKEADEEKVRRSSPTPGASRIFPHPPGRSIKKSSPPTAFLPVTTVKVSQAGPTNDYVTKYAETTVKGSVATFGDRATTHPDKPHSAPPPLAGKIVVATSKATTVLQEHQISAPPSTAKANERDVAQAHRSPTPDNALNLSESRVPTPSTARSRSPMPDPFVVDANRSPSVHIAHFGHSLHGVSTIADCVTSQRIQPQTQFNATMMRLAAQPDLPQLEVRAQVLHRAKEDESIPVALVHAIQKVYTDLAQEDFTRYTELREMRDEFPGQGADLAISMCEAMVRWRRAKAKAEMLGELIEENRKLLAGEDDVSDGEELT